MATVIETVFPEHIVVAVVAVTVLAADGAIHCMVTAVEALLSHLLVDVDVAVKAPPANNS